MISIRRSGEELERLQQLHAVALECYELALRSVAEYAVEVDAGDLTEFREHVEAIAAEWTRAGTTEARRSVQASFRGELCEYRDGIREKLTRLRNDLDAGARAIATFAASITINGQNHESQMKVELKRLDQLADCGSAEEMRQGIHAATAAITESVEKIRRSNQMIITQLQDEIRLLHQQLHAERKPPSSAAQGAWNREKLEERIREMVRQNQPFCLVLVNIRNLKRLENRHSKAVVEDALKTLVRRFHRMVGADAMVGRWSDAEFLAILDQQPGGTNSLTRDLPKKLSGDYAGPERSAQRTILEVAAGAIHHEPGTGAAAFAKKLTQLSAALAG